MQTYEESLNLFVRVVRDAVSRADIELLISLWKETSVLSHEDKKEVREIFNKCASELARGLKSQVNTKSLFK